MHVDEHVVFSRDGLVDLPDDDVGGTGERHDLGSAHPPIMPPSDPLPDKQAQLGPTIALASKCIGSVYLQ